MSITIFDLMLVAHFGFKTEFPTWLWVIAVITELGIWFRMSNVDKALKRVAP